MQFEGFKLIFGDSIHEFFAEGEFTLERQPHQIMAVLTLDKLDIVIRSIVEEEIILEIDTLCFICSNLLMLPEQRSIVLTVNSTATAA